MEACENFSGKSQHELEEFISLNVRRQLPADIFRDIRREAGYNPSKYMELLVYAAHIVRNEQPDVTQPQVGKSTQPSD